MANIVYGAPYIPPVDPAPAWSGMPMTWTAKGTEWALTDRSTGIFLLPGVRGLGSARQERHSTSSPAVAGSQYQGTSFLDREVMWPLKIWHNGGSTAWMERDRAFWKTMDPKDIGVWTVVHPDGNHRSLTLRFVDDGDHSRERNPLRIGWDRYNINLVAEQPFWVGRPVVRSFIGEAPPPPFFGNDGPIVNIASDFSAANARMDNPGDEESFPRWFIDGDTESAHVGVGEEIVHVPFPIDAGYCLVIESDPDLIGGTLYEITASGAEKKPSERVIGVDMINPVDMSPELGETDFAPVPAGAQVPLSLSISGTGAVEVLLPTLYRRPW
ncbi:hypothetical protein QE394_001097 [Arthrobacter sp. SORGH_AS 212]|uniref:hypothetical protein n=1 Tax=Pseudarthrobacter sp. SORGH_AS 212 TaxID=3041777 RepID=UPI00277D1BC7|nr:hypothetical protein [Arthrobacter sp. SORGH_AS_0212]